MRVVQFRIKIKEASARLFTRACLVKRRRALNAVMWAVRLRRAARQAQLRRKLRVCLLRVCFVVRLSRAAAATRLQRQRALRGKLRAAIVAAVCLARLTRAARAKHSGRLPTDGGGAI